MRLACRAAWTVSRPRNLNAYLHFEAVARRGSLTRAAEELSISPSAVSQQVKLLEQQLGVKLFRREGRFLSLTLEGEQLFTSAGHALRMLGEASDRLARRRAAWRLDIRVAPSFGVRWLGPRLARFVARHPDWDVRIDAAPDPTDFDREAMDADIRYGAGLWAGFHVRPLVGDWVLPLVSPGYRATLPDDPAAALAALRPIGSSRNLVQWGDWLSRQRLAGPDRGGMLQLDRSSMALQAALDGAGAVLESLALAGSDVAAGRLLPLCPAVPVLHYPAHWLVCPARALTRRPVTLFLDWIAEEAAAQSAEIGALLDRLGLRTETIDPASDLVRRRPGPA